MKKHSKEDFQKFAKEIYSEICDPNRAVQVLQVLRENDEFFAEVNEAAFRQEFLLSQLALGCVFWELLCAEQKIEEEESKKALLVIVMASFESPKSLDIAKRFSEYFCGNEESQDLEPIIAASKMLFHHLHRDHSLKDKDGNPKVTPGLQTLVGVYEAFRCSLETRLENFLNPLLGTE